MKKLVGVSLFIFWAALTAVLAAGLVFYQNSKTVNLSNSTPTTNNNSSSSSNEASLILNSAEISKHKSPSDCWIIVNNKIYNVTSFFFFYPGGSQLITPYCGKEATNAFNTQDRGSSHSAVADSLLASYYIGDLNKTVSQQQIQQNIQKTKAITPPPGVIREREDEEDD